MENAVNCQTNQPVANAMIAAAVHASQRQRDRREGLGSSRIDSLLCTLGYLCHLHIYRITIERSLRALNDKPIYAKKLGSARPRGRAYGSRNFSFSTSRRSAQRSRGPQTECLLRWHRS